MCPVQPLTCPRVRVCHWDLFRLPFNASSFHHPSSEFGDVCMQAGGKVGAERCLYLNVWQPASAAEAGGPAVLPIMFWIHGGAMKSGAGSEYDGTRLASAHGVIVISINYRLGVAGFWGSEALEQGNGLMGGIHDQIVALQWVQQHAALFGGDSKQVTIFGESKPSPLHIHQPASTRQDEALAASGWLAGC
jgi:para-nitrobenzyl esterase